MQHIKKNTYLTSTHQTFYQSIETKNNCTNLFQNASIIKSQSTFKHFFLSHFFSKTRSKTKYSFFLERFRNIKPLDVLTKHLKILNLKKNKNFFKYSTKKKFYITFSKKTLPTISKIFLNLYIKQVKFNAKKKTIFKKISVKLYYKNIEQKIFQKRLYARLKENFFSFYWLLHMHHINFLKQNFLWLFSILFGNKQINRFVYFYLFSKRTEIYYFSNFLTFFFKMSFLNIFLFNILYDCAKKQHLNNSNEWIFHKYWLFLQPFPYFFYNHVNFINLKLMTKKDLNKTIKKSFFVLCDEILVCSKIYKNFCQKNLNSISFIIFNYKLKNSFKYETVVNSFNKPNLILNTYYLDRYKTIYLFKLNLTKKEKKYYFYLKSIQSKNSTLQNLRFKFNSTVKKLIYKKIINRKSFKNFFYPFIKFLILGSKFQG